MNSLRKAVFLDRGGVINRKARGDGYITHWGEVVFLAGVIEAASCLNSAGFLVFVATNQRGIATGIVTQRIA